MSRYQCRKEAARARERFTPKATTEAEVAILQAQARMEDDIARDGKPHEMPGEMFDAEALKAVKAKAKMQKAEAVKAEKLAVKVRKEESLARLGGHAEE